jgi:hypothetical protein
VHGVLGMQPRPYTQGLQNHMSLEERSLLAERVAARGTPPMTRSYINAAGEKKVSNA